MTQQRNRQDIDRELDSMGEEGRTMKPGRKNSPSASTKKGSPSKSGSNKKSK